MNKVFLAFPFNPKGGRPILNLVRDIGRLLQSHGLVTVTGESVGGEELTPAVQRRIKESDALIALLTCERKLAGRGNKFLPTEWVLGELTSALARGQRAIALVQKGVDRGRGPFAENEYIPLDLAAPTDALIRLSENIGTWKAEAGRNLLVRLLPDTAAAIASKRSARCQVRLVPRQGVPGAWQDARVSIQPGGVFLAVPGVKDDVAIDVEIEDPPARLRSGEFPQWLHVEMRSV
jgi:hypothetical protein